MSEILIFRHIACEGPGYLGDYLDQRGLPFRVIEVDAGESVPVSIDGAKALVFMGGPMSVNDDLPWIEPSLHLIRLAHAGGVPVLGHCLGGQLIAKALGGLVTKSLATEIGWLPVWRRVWLTDLPGEFEAFHWHGETFTIPEHAQHIFESDACRNQGFLIGNSLALQFHIEMQPHMVSAWAEKYADQISEPSGTVQSFDSLTHNLTQRIEALHRIADKIYEFWTQKLG